VDRTDVKDGAAVALTDHVPQAGPGRQKGPVEVHGQNLPPVGEREVDQWRDVLDTGVADQDVDAAESSGDLVDTGLDLRLVGDVHRDRRRDAAAERDLAHDLLGPAEVEVRDGDFRAL